jgi:hypothetical protein
MLLAGCCAVLAGAAVPAEAQGNPELMAELRAIRAELDEQRALIRSQAERIERQEQELGKLRGGLVAAGGLEELRGAGTAQGAQAPAAAPAGPVGQAPELPAVEAQVQAVPEGQGVLTPRGRFVFDPSLEYTNSSNNRLVFRGIELIPGIQVGLIEASDADRDTLAATAAVRYGLTERLEIEARVPYLVRSDRIEVVQQREGSIVRRLELEERGIGDVEFAARYQINRPVGPRPIFVGSVRVKSDTGKGPFEIAFDDFGVATGLATGSGFWAVQPGLNFLLPSDPAVIFGGVAYLYHIARDIDRTIGDIFVGRVDPGDAISGNLGFGFALNPRFSYSLGYRHSYIFPTRSEIGDTVQRSDRLQVGSLNLGLSYRLTERRTVNFSFEFGVTEDAPDLGVTLRMPFGFDAPWRQPRPAASASP